MSVSAKNDTASRTFREIAGLAIAKRDGSLALEACDVWAELESAGYRVMPLAPAAGVASKPVRLRARYEGFCAACGAPIAVDDAIWWTRGVDGVECAPCGRKGGV